MCLVHATEGARVRLRHSVKDESCVVSSWRSMTCDEKHPSQSVCVAAASRGSEQVSQTVVQGMISFFSRWESWARIVRGRGSEGVRRERTRSPDYCSCTDGAADETAGKEGWGVRARQEHREMARDHVFVDVHEEHGAGQLPRKTL